MPSLVIETGFDPTPPSHGFNLQTKSVELLLSHLDDYCGVERAVTDCKCETEPYYKRAQQLMELFEFSLKNCKP